MDRKKLLTRAYELMLLAALFFAAVPFVRGCVSGMSESKDVPSVRLNQVSVGGLIQVPGESPGEVVFIYRHTANTFRVFAMKLAPAEAQRSGIRFVTPDGSLACRDVHMAFDRVVCQQADGERVWDSNGTGTAPGMPSLVFWRYRIDGDRLRYGAGA